MTDDLPADELFSDSWLVHSGQMTLTVHSKHNINYPILYKKNKIQLSNKIIIIQNAVWVDEWGFLGDKQSFCQHLMAKRHAILHLINISFLGAIDQKQAEDSLLTHHSWVLDIRLVTHDLCLLVKRLVAFQPLWFQPL